MSEESGKTWRVFCAIEIPSIVRERISEHIIRLRESSPTSSISWARPENIHLTLKFAGEISPAHAANLSQACANTTAVFSSFEIEVSGTGSFPPRGAPRVLWIGINDPSGKLAALQAKLAAEATSLGFEDEARAFRPHLTIARVRSPQGASELAKVHNEIGFTSTPVWVNEIRVIRSELNSRGSNYSTISRHLLADVPRF